MKDKPIVFFDGICGLCNGFVNLAMSWDSQKKLLFATLQGETSAKKLPSNLSEDMTTIVFYKNGKIYQKSRAVIEILFTLGGVGVLAKVFLVVPRFLSDAIYDIVAKYRYKVFGTQTCRVPSPQERERFLP